MKKLTTLFLLLICMSIQNSYAQLEITGSEDYGRIFDLTYDATVPNKVYAATLQNHILVSEDNGVTWDVLYTLEIGQGSSVKDMKLTADGSALTFSAYLPGTAVNAIMVYDITSASIVKTFSLPNQDDLAYVKSYDIYGANMDVLIVDTNFPVGIDTEGKTFYTANGGDTWNMIYYTVDNNSIFINSVAIDPLDPNHLFLTRGNGDQGTMGGVLISDDAGENFTEKLAGVVLDPIAFDPLNNQNIFIGTGIEFTGIEENLYKSVDGGETFSIVPITWTSGTLDNISVIKFNKNNPSQMIILEENEIAISEDSGETFQNYVYADINDSESYYYGLNASYNPQDSNQIFISANYIPLFSNDGGQTLTWAKSEFFASTGSMDLFLNDNDANLYYGVQYGYVHRDLNTNNDTPHNILPLSTFTSSTGQTLFADQLVANRIYLFSSGFSGANVTVSNDNGATETYLLSLFTLGLSDVATFQTEPETILAAFKGYSATGTILKKINFSDPNNIVQNDITLPAFNYINGIVIDENDKITISIGVEIYASTDNGVTWTNQSSGLEVLTENDLILDLVQDPLNNDRFALATTNGIFISVDGGATWDQKTTSWISNIAFSTETEGALIASTYSSMYTLFALHYSTDYGENWNTINNQQLLTINAQTSKFKFLENAIKAYIGTNDLGLVEYTIDLASLGTNDYDLASNQVAMYPNPTHTTVNVTLKDSNVTKISIYSINSAKVMEVNGVSTVNVSSLQPGIYMLRIQNDQNEIFFKKMIKN